MEEYICKICRQFQLNAYQNISVSFAKIKLPPCIACKRFNARPSKNQKRLPASFKKVRVGVHIMCVLVCKLVPSLKNSILFQT